MSPPSLEEALEGVAQAARLSHEAQLAAEQEAADFRAQAAEWENRYRKERRRAESLRAQFVRRGIPLAGGVCLPQKQHAALQQRRHTLPTYPNGASSQVSDLSGPQQPENHSSGIARQPSQSTSPSDVSIAALSSTLAACLLLQNATQQAGLASHLTRHDTEGGEHELISVADDGRSGVAATAAAAVSVALAQSWAAVAGGKSSVMPHRDVANDSIPERARFKLVAAVPRNVKPHREVSSPSPQVPLRPAPPGIPRSGSQQSIANGGDGGMALESLDDAQVLDDRQEATWRASGGHLKLHWLSPPKTALVVYKPTDEVVEATGRAIAWLLTRGLIVYVEPEAHGEIHTVTLQLLQDVCQAQASGTTATAMERTESTGSAVFGAISPRSPSALEAEHKREATTDTAANAVELLQRSLMTWPSGAAGCDHVLPGDVANRFDMVLTLGGDGTVLWACSLFGREAIPPLVPLAMGSLGFMTPFPLNRMDSVLSRVTSVAAGFPLMLRHRLQCRIVRAGEPGDDQVPGIATNPFLAPAPCGDDVLVLNEVVIDRGMTSTLANVQCFVDKNFVTSVQGDGLIVSTPTGSTAYNLAAGGSMVHPAVPCILFTPICPHTLSSRPVVFPEHVTLHVKVPSDSRFEAYCSFDGRARRALRPGDSVFIQLSQRPVPMVCNRDATHDWFMSVREGLHWNRRAVQKPMERRDTSYAVPGEDLTPAHSSEH